MSDIQIDALLKAGAATFGVMVLIAFLSGLVTGIQRRRARAVAPIIAAMERLGLELWQRGDLLVYRDPDLGWRVVALGTTPGGASVQWEIDG